MYINALILPDNLAVPFLIFAVGIVILIEINYLSLGWVGLLLGIAMAAKPFFVFFSLVFIGYVFSNSPKNNRIWNICFFTICLAIVPLVTVVANDHYSQGKIKGLGSNGGVNFFQGWAHPGRVTSISSEGKFWVESPSSAQGMSWKPFNTNEPIYHQKYFYSLGVKAIEKDPSVLLKKIFWLGNIFFGKWIPTLSQQPYGYIQCMTISGRILYVMFCIIWIFYIFPLNNNGPNNIYFLFTLLFIFFISVYLFGMPERRYLFYIEFLILIIFFPVLEKIIFYYKNYENKIIVYLIGVGIFIASTPFVCALYR